MYRSIWQAVRATVGKLHVFPDGATRVTLYSKTGLLLAAGQMQNAISPKTLRSFARYHSRRLILINKDIG